MYSFTICYIVHLPSQGSNMNDIFINKDWFKVWEKSHYPPTIPELGTILSLYSPHFLDDNEREQNGDYTAGVTLGVFKHWDDKGRKEKNNIILFSMFPRKLLNSAELINHTRNLCCDYLNNSDIKVYEGYSPDILLVPAQEGVRSHIIAQIAERNNEVPVKRFYYNNEGKTLDNMVVRILPRIVTIPPPASAKSTTPPIDGRLWVASNPMDKSSLRNVDAQFLATICSYPEVEAKATLWALAQAVIYLENYGIFKDEEIGRDNTTRPKHKFYGP